MQSRFIALDFSETNSYIEMGNNGWQVHSNTYVGFGDRHVYQVMSNNTEGFIKQIEGTKLQVEEINASVAFSSEDGAGILYKGWNINNVASPTNARYGFIFGPDKYIHPKLSTSIFGSGDTAQLIIDFDLTQFEYTLLYQPGIATKSNGEKVEIKGDDKSFKVVGGETVVKAIENPFGYYETFDFGGWLAYNGTIYQPKDDIVRLTRKDGGVATLSAIWKEIDYNVILQAGYTIQNQRIEGIKYSQEFVVPEKPFIRPGYRISTYSLVRVESSLDNPMIIDKKAKEEIVPGEKVSGLIDKISSSSHVLIYAANWQLNNYKINYNRGILPYEVDDGTQSMEPSEGTVLTNTRLKANTFTNAGMRFVGWSTNSNATTPEFSVTSTIRDVVLRNYENLEINLYAIWEKQLYTLIFDGNNGTYSDGYSSKQARLYYEDDIEYPVPRRDGYVFKGFTTTRDGEIYYNEIKWREVENRLIFAKWEVAKSILYVNANGGTINGSKELQLKMEYNDPIPINDIIDMVDERIGYVKLGIFTSSTITTEEYRYTETQWKEEKDKEVYVGWKAKEYIITYNPNNGVGERMASTSVTIESNSKLASASYTYEGRNFLGWSTNRFDTIPLYENEADAVRVIEDNSQKSEIELYAIWARVEYILTLRAEGGVYADSSTTKQMRYKYGDIIALESPKRAGHAFMGYFTNTDYVEKYQKDIWNESANRVIYASWSVAEYKLTVDANGGTIAGLLTVDLPMTVGKK